MQQRPLSVLSQIYRVWAGVRLEECMTWQETWIPPQAYGFRKKRGATDAAGMISLLIELCHVMQTTLMGFGLDYVKCFDLIPQQVVILVAKEEGMDEGVHGAQGHFERRCSVVSTMITATGLHAAEIVPLQPKSLSSFETKIITTIWGPSRPTRAKEIVFCLLCVGCRIAPTLIIPYQRAVWLAKLCRTRGPSLVLAQAIWEKHPSPQSPGPFGKALQTLHNWAGPQHKGGGNGQRQALPNP